MKFDVNEIDIGISYQDEGPWRSYGVESSGSTIEELFENATVYETDQDGGELASYSLEEAEYEVCIAAKRILGDFIEELNCES